MKAHPVVSAQFWYVIGREPPVPCMGWTEVWAGLQSAFLGLEDDSTLLAFGACCDGIEFAECWPKAIWEAIAEGAGAFRSYVYVFHG